MPEQIAQNMRRIGLFFFIFLLPVTFSLHDIVHVQVAEAALPLVAGAMALWEGIKGAASTAAWVLLYVVAAQALASAFFTLSGMLFDVCLQFSVTGFGSWYTSLGMDQAVGLIWQVFRDLGNIVIIFMFVYIAFRTILDTHDYNLKTHAVRIIIIALFINFSLFFTKVVIDISNYFAYQFYLGIANLATTITANGGTPNNAPSIYTFFLSALHIGDFYNYGSLIWESLKGFQFGTLIASVTGMFFFQILAGAVFLYGAILLIIRMLLLIVLMCLSSLAFASYIIPSMEDYFKQWYTALFQQAIFAPIFMVMLWMVVHLTSALVAFNKSSLSEAFQKPSINSAIAILSYLMILGFLFIAIKISSSLAAKGDKALFGIGKNIREGLLSAGFGGLAASQQALALRRGRSSLERFEADRKDAEGRGDAAGMAKADKSIEKLQKRLDRTADFRTGMIGKALKGAGIATGDASKDKLKKLIEKERSDQKAEMEKMQKIAQAARSKQDEKTQKEAVTKERETQAATNASNKKEVERIEKVVQEGDREEPARNQKLAEQQRIVATQEKELEKMEREIQGDSTGAKKAQYTTKMEETKRDIEVARKEVEQLQAKSTEHAENKKRLSDLQGQISAYDKREAEYGKKEKERLEKEEKANALRDRSTKVLNDVLTAYGKTDYIGAAGNKGKLYEGGIKYTSLDEKGVKQVKNEEYRETAYAANKKRVDTKDEGEEKSKGSGKKDEHGGDDSHEKKAEKGGHGDGHG